MEMTEQAFLDCYEICADEYDCPPSVEATMNALLKPENLYIIVEAYKWSWGDTVVRDELYLLMGKL